MDPLAALLLGWLLGLLGAPIVDRIRRSYRRDELEAALAAELQETRFTLVALVYRLRQHMGKLDQATLGWLAPLYEEYRGPDADPKQVEAMRELLKLTPAQLSSLSRDKSTQGISLLLKTYAMPFLQSQVANLAVLSVGMQQRLLDMHSKLDLLNQQARQLMQEHNRTFDSGLSPADHQVVRSNLQSGYIDMAGRAQKLANLITAALSSLKPAHAHEADGAEHHLEKPKPIKGAVTKMKKSPWHSIKADVHHVCTNCNTGNNIETENVRQGTGGKPLCQECSGLISRGGC